MQEWEFNFNIRSLLSFIIGWVGACQNTVSNCVGGVPQTCSPGTPTTEVCDNLDNDCDGLVDEVCP